MNDERLKRARIALEGLSVGDAFGGFFEFNAAMVRLIQERKLPPTPWNYTDDTNMALSVYEILRKEGAINQDKLAASFAQHFDPMRGYGVGVRTMVSRIGNGEPWQAVASDMFWGEGSFGNDGAMRVAPVGAYFADDIERVIEQTRLATEVTHTHHEGIAGALAVSLAVAYAWQFRDDAMDRQKLIASVLSHLPAGAVYDGLQRAHDLPADTTAQDAADALGNGSQVSVQDTVPFVLWCAGENLNDYQEAIWQGARALGDVDTICAMVGGIVIMRTGAEGIPLDWLRHRERLPEWPFSGE